MRNSVAIGMMALALMVGLQCGHAQASQASQASQAEADWYMRLFSGSHSGTLNLQQTLTMAQKAWHMLDPDGGSTISPAVKELNPDGAAILNGVSPNAQGVYTLNDLLASVPGRFRAADRDHDGLLDRAEVAAFLGLGPPTAESDVIPPGIRITASGLPSCSRLATDPAYGLKGRKGITHLTAAAVPVSGWTRVAYCRVDFVYNSGKSGPKYGYRPGQTQAIGIRVGLPLRTDDGGIGAWNGKIHNLGSGGCMGYLGDVTPATNDAYAGATSDGGHGPPSVGFNCTFGVNQDTHTNNIGLIRDFSRDHIIWQTYWSKALVKIYYGDTPRRTYWTGCSQGGREAAIVAQVAPQQYDGILGGGAALYWMRFQLAQAWPGLVIKDMLRPKGETLTTNQIAATVLAEVKACEAKDAAADGVLGDPRTCHWSAKSAICGVRGAPTKDCLNADQAAAFDRIRRGPRNHAGQLIWYPWEPGTTVSNRTNFLLSDGTMQWAVRDSNFSSDAHLYMDEAHLRAARDPLGITYEDMATLASRRLSNVADTDDAALDAARKSGVKLLLWTGTADRNILAQDSIKYYRDVAAHFGMQVGDARLQSWFRLFLYPGVDHCVGGAGPQPGDINDGPLFQALVRWVEDGVSPTHIVATKYIPESPASGSGGSEGERWRVMTRPVCPYPQTAVYDDRGSTDDAANFTCGGDLETREVVVQAKLAKHRFENVTGIVPPPYGPADANSAPQLK